MGFILGQTFSVRGCEQENEHSTGGQQPVLSFFALVFHEVQEKSPDE